MTKSVLRRTSQVDSNGDKRKYSVKAAVGWPWPLNNQFMTRHTPRGDETAPSSSLGRYGTQLPKIWAATKYFVGSPNSWISLCQYWCHSGKPMLVLSKPIKWTEISMIFMEKNGPRMSICIIKTRTCLCGGPTRRVDENESFFGVWSGEKKMRRRRAPRLISFSVSRATTMRLIRKLT